MQTETLEITLPLHLVERLRERIRTGEFTDVNAAVVNALEQIEAVEVWRSLPEEPFQGAFEHYLKNEVAPRVQSIQDGTAAVYTMEEVRARLAQQGVGSAVQL